MISHTHERVLIDGFQNRKFWGLSKLAILVHQQFWYLFGFFGTQKGTKIDEFQIGNCVLGLLKLAVLVHQQFWYLFGFLGR